MQKKFVSNKEYLDIHNWLRDKYGAARKCQNVLCKKENTSYQWCLKRNCAYEFKRSKFIQLCKSCHASYDHQTRRELSEQPYVREKNVYKQIRLTESTFMYLKFLTIFKNMTANKLISFLLIRYKIKIPKEWDAEKYLEKMKGQFKT